MSFVSRLDSQPLTRFSGINRASQAFDPLTGEPTRYDHSTWMFRDPQVMQFFPTVLGTCFPNGADIQIHGASDGSEVYALLMLLNNTIGSEEVAKKYPIKGFDISSSRIALAQRGVLGMTEGEVKTCEALAERRIHEFVDPLPDTAVTDADRRIPDAAPEDLLDEPCTSPQFRDLKKRDLATRFYRYYRVKPDIHRLAHFDVADIRQRAKQPFTQPTVVFLKHVLGYLKPDESRDVVRDLYQNLPAGSMLVIGEDEAETSLALGIQAVGFRTLGSPELKGLYRSYWMKPRPKPA